MESLRRDEEKELGKLRERHTRVMAYNVRLRQAVTEYLADPNDENRQLLIAALNEE